VEYKFRHHQENSILKLHAHKFSREQKPGYRVYCPFVTRGELKDRKHAQYDTSYYPYSAFDRRSAELGLQPRLGLWTFWRFGASSRHYHYPCPDGPHLKAM
jgi:hypothetical protein